MKTRARVVGSSPNRTDGAAAFTLIELLVVVGILAVLAGLLLPALSRAKAAGQGIKCLSNLKQVQLAWMMYAEDNGDTLVSNVSRKEGPGYEGRLPWVESGDYDQPGNPECTNLLYLLDRSMAAFADYIQAPGVYRCPGDRSTVLISGQERPRTRSYTLNLWLGRPSSPDDPRPKISKVSGIVAPEPVHRFTFLDTHPNWIYNLYFLPPDPPSGQADDNASDYVVRDTTGSITYAGVVQFNSFPATHHNSSGNLAFADGHAEKHTWLDGRTRVPDSIRTEDGADDTPQYRQPPQISNPDVFWLGQRGATRFP